jgi:uncharacterized protein (TIGR00297 family)
MDGPPHSEEARKLIHMAMGGFALLLRFISWHAALILAGTAIAFNLIVLPRVGRRLYRPADHARRFPPGIVFYPVSVLLLVLLFHGRPDIAAAAWGILAIGDGMATLVGKRFGRTRIPWNREKSVAGSLALFLCGGIAGAFLAWWCRPNVIPPPYLWFSLGAPFVAALVAAFVETIPVRLDDNLSVPAAAAGVLWALSLVSEDLVRSAASAAATSIAPAAAVNIVVAWLGYRARTVTLSGAVCGASIGTAIAIATGWRGWTLLLLTFAVATISSRMGVHRKTLLGIAEERGGRRGAGNAIANTGLAAAAALMSILTYAREPALLAFVAALAAGGSDTIASEIGKAWGRRTYSMPAFRLVPPGTSGAMSIEGTVAGLIGAIALSAAAIALDLIPASAIIPVVAGATIGSLAESLLGATLESRGILNNHLLNFLNTGIAVAAAIILAGAGP